MNRFAKYFAFAVSLASAAYAQESDTPRPTSPASTKSVLTKNPFDDTYQFIFFATLEGFTVDGVSDTDVEALLATKGQDGGYLNFIYTCPICMPVEGAIVTYKARPSIHHLEKPQPPDHGTYLRRAGSIAGSLRCVALRKGKHPPKSCE